MTTVDFGGRRWAVGGGGYFRLMPYSLTRAAIARVNGEGRPVVVYFHPYEFSPEPLQLPLPPWQRYVTSARYTWLHNINRGANRRRFTRLLRDFRFGPIAELLERPT